MIDLRSAAGTRVIDPAASTARFSIDYLAFSRLHGRFGAVEGTIDIDPHDPARSRVEASIDVTAIDTGIGLRDAHLRSSHFFHASRFPQVTFRSTRVEQLDEASWSVVGDLTVRDIAREVVLETVYDGHATGPNGSRATFSATTTLSRKAFGLGRHGGGLIVSDLVVVSLEIAAVSPRDAS